MVLESSMGEIVRLAVVPSSDSAKPSHTDGLVSFYPAHRIV